MLQGVLWLFDDPVSDLLLAGILVFAALHHRQMRLLQRRTNELALHVSELKMLMVTTPGGSHSIPDGPSVTQRGSPVRFDGRPLPH
jgi:hypothetical protein